MSLNMICNKGLQIYKLLIGLTVINVIFWFYFQIIPPINDSNSLIILLGRWSGYENKSYNHENEYHIVIGILII